MTLLDALNAIGVMVPLALIAATIVGLVYFVRFKGAIDGLKETANSYKELATSRTESLKDLELKIEDLKIRVLELEAILLEVRSKSICYHMYDCRNFRSYGSVRDDEKTVGYEHL